MTQVPHGTLHGYTYHRCRCLECTATMGNYHREWATVHPDLAPDDPRHGTFNGYSNWHCRCQHCKDAAVAYRAARRGAA